MGDVPLDDGKERHQEAEEDEHIQPSPWSDGQLGSRPDRQPVPSDKHAEHDSCIWDSHEIEVLRRVFKATSDENALLHSQVCVLQNDVEKLTAERRAERRSLESTRQRVHRAETANKRLQMIVNHLKTELD